MQHLVENPDAPHKICLSDRPSCRWRCWPGRLLSLLGLAACLALYLQLNYAQNPGLIQPEGIYFIDADCYSRMTRVRLLEEGGGPFLSYHTFENAPVGLNPHTTAPLDWAILAWHRLHQRSPDLLDRSGYEISPLLGGLLLIAIWAWTGWLRVPYRWAVCGLFALSPALLHAFAAGRPDHQSLVLLLCGLGLLLEAGAWQGQRRLWLDWASGVVWGLALWTSWFEPLVLLLAIWTLRLLRIWFSGASRPANLPGWSSYVITLALAGLAMVFEGVPGLGLPPELRSSFFLWSASIGELQGGQPLLLLSHWAGWGSLLVLPGLLWACFRSFRRLPPSSPALAGGGAWLWLGLLLLLVGLTFWHLRWGYFLILVTLLALPWALPALLPFRHGKWLGYALLFFGLWPLAT